MAYVIGEDCISCGTCAGECPVEAISEGAERYVIDADACTKIKPRSIPSIGVFVFIIIKKKASCGGSLLSLWMKRSCSYFRFWISRAGLYSGSITRIFSAYSLAPGTFLLM